MDPSEHVGKTLHRVLSLSLAPVMGTCAGINTGGFEPVACRDDGGTQYLSGLQPAAAADYLELREPSRPEGGEPRTLESFGARCARATDRAACEAKIAAATSPRGFMPGECVQICQESTLIVNAGDTVTVLSSKKDVRAWLGPIDTPEEAVLLVALENYNVGCGDDEYGGVRRKGNGYEVLATRYTSDCAPIEKTLFVLRVDADGNVREVKSEVIESMPNACIGRRPEGLVPGGGRGATRVGAWFAEVAQLEAASVRAFEVLRRELIHHGAPQDLVAQALAARQDEVRHARVMRRVAARYGGEWRAPQVERRPLRSLEEIAVENAAEGCVRETFGALIGMWQARFAGDRDVRRVMRRIARDETRHASLAWAIDGWVRPQLSAAAQRRVAEARRGALDEVAAEARREPDGELVQRAGLPGPGAAERLAANFAQAVVALEAA